MTTVSESNLSNTWDRLEWHALSHEIARSDIATLLKYRDGFESVSPVYLFWELYRPSVLHDDGSKSPAPELSSQVKSLVLELLNDLYHRYRVPYEPDQDDSDIREYLEAGEKYEFTDAGLAFPDNLKNLLIIIHVAAARAFVLKQDSGFSDEVLDCLNEVKRSWQRLSLNGYPGSASGYDADYYEVFHSIDAISALTLVELARVNRNQGNYTQALHMMAEASERYSRGAILVMGPVDWWPQNINTEESPSIPVISPFDEFLTGMHAPVEDVLETFNLLKSSGYDGDWTQVAHDCRRLAGAHFLCFPKNPPVEWDDEDENGIEDYRGFSEEYLWPEAPRWPGGVLAGDYWEISQELMDQYSTTDEQSNAVTWSGFWLIAHGWALAQLSRNEYRKMREDDEKHATENRLKNYFFRSDWSYLPERAQQRLINADLIWNSPQRVSRESILNDLLRASEEMCERFIVQPFMNDERTSSDILGIEAKVAEDVRRSSLGVREYISICELPSLPDSLAERNLADSEIRFIVEKLPTTLRQLTDARNDADHEIGTFVSPELVDSAYRLFLGIGQPGILPELARIGRKL